MKLIYTLLLSFLLFSLTVGAQNPSITVTTFGKLDLLNYMATSRIGMSEKVFDLIKNNSLAVYSDEAMKNELTVEQFKALGEIREPKQIPNPENPDDIYDLIDTVIITDFYGNMSTGFILINDDAVAYQLRAGKQVYFSYKKTIKKIGKEYAALLKFYRSKGQENITNKSLIGFSNLLLKQWSVAWYNYGASGELKGYRNDSLVSFFSKEEIEDRTMLKRIVQVYNPDNDPPDPYDLIDTIITTPFEAEKSERLRVYYIWKGEGFESEAKFYGVSPLFQPKIAGMTLPYTPVFLLKAKDLLKKTNKTEAAFFQYYFYWLVKDRANDETHRDKVFYEEGDLFKD